MYFIIITFIYFNILCFHFKKLTAQAKAVDQVSLESGEGNKLPMQFRPAMLLHEAAIRRNKRCLLAYHKYKMEKLKALRWDTSASLPEHVRSLLSEKEVHFYTEYDKLVTRYNSSLGTLELNSYMQPPEEDLVEIRVVQSGLETIETDHFGEVSLDMGSTHFLSRGDVEHLIRQGSLQQLDGEETY